MERPSLKKTIVNEFATAIFSDPHKRHELVLFTACGTISGYPEPMPDGFTTDKLNIFSNSYTQEYRKKYEITDVVPDNDGYVLLSKAKIKSESGVVEYPSIIVFFDQIIGMTLSEIV